jgi:hypothetical protein
MRQANFCGCPEDADRRNRQGINAVGYEAEGVLNSRSGL